MKHRMHWAWAAALLLAPLTAAAQHPAPDAERGPAPPARVEPAAADDDLAMFLDDDGEDMAMAWDDEGGGDGERQVHRIVLGGPHARGMRMREGMAMRFAALDLTDAQRDKLRDIHEAAARRNVQRRADLQLARMDLHKLMRADAPSTSSINAQIDKISRLQSDGMKAHLDTWMQARAVLTPEQLKKLKSGPGAMPRRRMMEHGMGDVH